MIHPFVFRLPSSVAIPIHISAALYWFLALHPIRAQEGDQRLDLSLVQAQVRHIRVWLDRRGIFQPSAQVVGVPAVGGQVRKLAAHPRSWERGMVMAGYAPLG